MPLDFIAQDVKFTLKQKKKVSTWILAVIRKEKKKAGSISYTFCSDRFLLALNKKFLKHNTLTDIITFKYPGNALSGEVFISIPRIKENAKTYKVTFENELHRVMIHGILHLCGYTDKTAATKKVMRRKEDYYLKITKV